MPFPVLNYIYTSIVGASSLEPPSDPSASASSSPDPSSPNPADPSTNASSPRPPASTPGSTKYPYRSAYAPFPIWVPPKASGDTIPRPEAVWTSSESFIDDRPDSSNNQPPLPPLSMEKPRDKAASTKKICTSGCASSTVWSVSCAKLAGLFFERQSGPCSVPLPFAPSDLTISSLAAADPSALLASCSSAQGPSLDLLQAEPSVNRPNAMEAEEGMVLKLQKEQEAKTLALQEQYITNQVKINCAEYIRDFSLCE